MSLDETTGNEAWRIAKRETARAISKIDWECPHCHRNLPLNTKGNHLRTCKLNPDRKVRIRKGSKRSDLIPCEYCQKGLAPDSMDAHVKKACRVAQAIREGRLVEATLMKVGAATIDTGLAVTTETFDPPIAVGEGAQLGWVVDGAGVGHLSFDVEPPQDVDTTPAQLDLVKTILEVAVEEILDDQLVTHMTFAKARRIDAGLMAFVDVLMRELRT